MANTGLVTLGSLRIQAQQRSDMVNSQFVTTPEWNLYLTNSYKELFDLLITHYGDDYMVASPYQFRTSSSTQLYPLPDGLTTTDVTTGLVAVPLYKLIGVDLLVTSSPLSWATLRRFEFTERNNYQLQTLYAPSGAPTYRYKVVGSNLWLTPPPSSSQTLQLWYVPKPTNLLATVSCGTTSGSAVFTTSDTSQLAVGMSVADLVLPQGATQVVPDNATIASIVANTSFSISATAGATKTGYLIGAWSDSTTLDGISGWEEYVVVDAAMKAAAKEETDVSVLMAQKAAMQKRIEETASNRDASLPARVSDTQSIEVGWPGMGWSGSEW